MQDLFADTEVTSINISSMTRFYRRINVWLVLFYKGDERHAQTLAPVYKDLAKKYYGIFEIAAINCAEEEEICQEFEVLETPALMGYKSDSNDGMKYGDEETFLGNQTLGKLAMFAVNLMDDFVSIITDSNYLEFANKNPSKLKIF
jgi:thiol-disulfide isomerase/thioredoxin